MCNNAIICEKDSLNVRGAAEEGVRGAATPPRAFPAFLAAGDFVYSKSWRRQLGVKASGAFSPRGFGFELGVYMLVGTTYLTRGGVKLLTMEVGCHGDRHQQLQAACWSCDDLGDPGARSVDVEHASPFEIVPVRMQSHENAW